MRTFKLLLSSAILLVAGTAFAQDADQTSNRKVKYKERTEIDFDGVNVDGELTKPAIKTVSGSKAIKFDIMLTLRKDFSKELKKSVDEVK